MVTLPLPELVIQTFATEWGRQRPQRRFVKFTKNGGVILYRKIANVSDDAVYKEFSTLATSLMQAGARDPSTSKTYKFDARLMTADKARLLPKRKKKMSYILELMRSEEGGASKGLLQVDIGRGRIEGVVNRPEDATKFDEFHKIGTYLVNRGSNYGTGEIYRLHELDDKGNLVRIR